MVLYLLDSYTFDLPFFPGPKCRPRIKSPGQHGVWEEKSPQSGEKCLKEDQWKQREQQINPNKAEHSLLPCSL